MENNSSITTFKQTYFDDGKTLVVSGDGKIIGGVTITDKVENLIIEGNVEIGGNLQISSKNLFVLGQVTVEGENTIQVENLFANTKLISSGTNSVKATFIAIKHLLVKSTKGPAEIVADKIIDSRESHHEEILEKIKECGINQKAIALKILQITDKK